MHSPTITASRLSRRAACRLHGKELSKRLGERFVTPIGAVSGVALPFVAFGVSGQLPGVRELWRYHGAEHKAVRTAESGRYGSAERVLSCLLQRHRSALQPGTGERRGSQRLTQHGNLGVVQALFEG
jgi:hypothetical protein